MQIHGWILITGLSLACLACSPSASDPQSDPAKLATDTKKRATVEGVDAINTHKATIKPETLKAEIVTEQDLGLPFYPGSENVPMATVMNGSGPGRTIISSRTTTDSPSKVREFYQGKVESIQLNLFNATQPVSTAIKGKNKAGDAVFVTAMQRANSPTEIMVQVTQAAPKG